MEVQENISSNISEEPKIDVPKTVEKLEAPKRKNSGFIVGMLLFLIVALIGGLVFYVLKDNGINLLSGNTTDTTTSDDDTSSTEESTTTTCTTVGETCKVGVTNTGWALFALPKYNFSVEVPSYTMIQKLPETTSEGTTNVDIQSVWTFRHEESTKTSFLNNYVHSAWLSFYPVRIPEGLGCGQGCVKEHDITVDIFQNSGKLDLNGAITQYMTNWNAKYGGDEEIKINGDVTTKWGVSVWKYTQQLIGGTENGYVVVTNDYIYEVSYFISETPAESYQVALKVLDSMKF